MGKRGIHFRCVDISWRMKLRTYPSDVNSHECVKRGALGFSDLRFWLFFRSVFSVFVAKDVGFSVLVVIAVCGFFVC